MVEWINSVRNVVADMEQEITDSTEYEVIKTYDVFADAIKSRM